MPDAAQPPRLRHRLEYGVFRALAISAAALPYRAALALAWVIAAALFHVARFRRRETLRRIQSVLGPSMPARHARRIAWLSLRNLAFNAVEMLRIRRFSEATIRRHMPDFDAALAALRAAVGAHGRTTGAVVGIPHMGNWDLAGSACFLGGLPIFSVAARQRNPLMNDYINRLRSGHGMDILERGAGTLRQVVDRLRSGQLFAILPDTRSRQPDLAIPFLGSEANLARGMASFARAADVPIIPVIVIRERWTRFRITVHPPVFPDPSLEKTADLLRMTRHVVALIDAAIREHPDQWFWYNKRWVLEPLAPCQGPAS
jgi:KDO2-lipid IV(A) lauroyltransferase